MNMNISSYLSSRNVVQSTISSQQLFVSCTLQQGLHWINVPTIFLLNSLPIPQSLAEMNQSNLTYWRDKVMKIRPKTAEDAQLWIQTSIYSFMPYNQLNSQQFFKPPILVGLVCVCVLERTILDQDVDISTLREYAYTSDRCYNTWIFPSYAFSKRVF